MSSTLCPREQADEMVAVFALAHNRVFGHWAGTHGSCACPAPPNAPAATLGAERATRLVELLTKFAYEIHTPDEEAEMAALVHQSGRKR